MKLKRVTVLIYKLNLNVIHTLNVTLTTASASAFFFFFFLAPLKCSRQHLRYFTITSAKTICLNHASLFTCQFYFDIEVVYLILALLNIQKSKVVELNFNRLKNKSGGHWSMTSQF